MIAAIARLTWWTLPALREVRRSISPPVAAMEWIRGNVPKSRPLSVHEGMAPCAGCCTPDYNVVIVDEPAKLPIAAFSASDWLVTEGPSAVVNGRNFIREHGNLYDIARRRYFEVSVVPLSSVALFSAGWYAPEGEAAHRWRWMGGRSITMLPPIAGKARLTLDFDLPTELVPRHPTVEIYLNGQLVDRSVCTTPSVSRTVIVPASGNMWNQLVISMDKVLNPAKEGILPDARDLSLNLTGYGWEAANVSQSSMRPDSNPRLNHIDR